jgi:hypothetical protein
MLCRPQRRTKEWKVGPDVKCYYFFNGATAPTGPGPPYYRGFAWHSDTPYLVGLLYGRHRPVAESSTWQYITFTREDFHAPGGIWTRSSSKGAAGDLNLRPRSNRDRHFIYRNKFTWSLDRANQMVPLYPCCRKFVKLSKLCALCYCATEACTKRLFIV